MSQYTTSEKGIHLIKRFESLHDGDLSIVGLQPKLCPAGIWTEGYGHAMIHEGKFIKGAANKALAYRVSQVKTEADAQRLLARDLVKFEKQVNARKLPLTQNKFDALVSFFFNLGAGAFDQSTLKKRIIANDPRIAGAFAMWNKADTNADGILEVLKGLTLRREAEAKLYLS